MDKDIHQVLNMRSSYQYRKLFWELIDLSGIPEMLVKTLKRELVEVEDELIDFVASYKRNGRGLLIYGDVGVGKTYAMGLLGCLLIEKAIFQNIEEMNIIYTDKGVKFRDDYIYLNDIMWVDTRKVLSLYHTYGDDDRRRMFDVQILLWDEWDIEKRTENEYRIIDDVFLYRYNNGKSTILTTNLSLKDLRVMRDDPLYRRACDRLLDKDRFKRLYIKGKTKRRIK